ncbi:MAG TPA: hypothetical protein VN207_03005 [Ktedonobacteraceae bacterium]|nr:hypothetical protein [Ktedonobacteraceae bacterium]
MKLVDFFIENAIKEEVLLLVNDGGVHYNINILRANMLKRDVLGLIGFQQQIGHPATDEH